MKIKDANLQKITLKYFIYLFIFCTSQAQTDWCQTQNAVIFFYRWSIIRDSLLCNLTWGTRITAQNSSRTCNDVLFTICFTAWITYSAMPCRALRSIIARNRYKATWYYVRNGNDLRTYASCNRGWKQAVFGWEAQVAEYRPSVLEMNQHFCGTFISWIKQKKTNIQNTQGLWRAQSSTLKTSWPLISKSPKKG